MMTVSCLIVPRAQRRILVVAVQTKIPLCCPTEASLCSRQKEDPLRSCPKEDVAAHRRLPCCSCPRIPVGDVQRGSFLWLTHTKILGLEILGLAIPLIRASTLLGWWN